MYITDKDYVNSSSNWYYQQEQIIKSAAKQAYNNGMAVTFLWHLREPSKEEEFYTYYMTSAQKANAFKSILPGGTKHAWYKKKLDKVASTFNSLVGNDGKKIPVIFRPFHEFDGEWFWWGAKYCTAAEYKQLWQFTVKYLRDTKKLNNILFNYCPDESFTTKAQYLNYYPGDAYVDVLAMDNYDDFYDQNSAGVALANKKLKIVSDLAIEKNKVAALAETGYTSSNETQRINNHFTSLVYPAITNNNVQIAFVCFWANLANEYFVPTPATPYATDFKNFSKKPKMKLQNGLTSSLYTIQ